MSAAALKVPMGVTCLAALLALAPSLLGQNVFRSTTDLVSVDVAVRAGNSIVKGLSSADFELLDNGVPQQIDAMAIETVPIDLTLILDASGSTAPIIDRFKSRAQQLAAMLRTEDRARLVSFATEVVEIFPLRFGAERLPVDQLRSRGGTSLHDALLLSLVRTPAAGRRQLIVAFTDGLDTTSVVDAATIAAVAARADSVLHLVLSGAYPTATSNLPPTVRSLRTAAEASGGELHPPGALGDAVEAFQRLFEDFRQSYVLRYTVRGVPRSGWHDINVRVTRPSSRYSVRARKGYFGG